MRRFYRDLRAALLALAMMPGPVSAAPQSAALPPQPLLGSTLTADLLRDLPTSNNPFSVAENIQPKTISELFSAGGLNAATAPKVGGFLNSWTQTQFRVGDITVTDPRAGGTPLLLPSLPFWDASRRNRCDGGRRQRAGVVDVAGTAEARRNMAPRGRGIVLGPGAGVGGGRPVPAVDRVRQWQDGSVMVSGPLTGRLGLVAAGSWRNCRMWPHRARARRAIAWRPDWRISCLRRHRETRSARSAGRSGQRRRGHGYRGARPVHLGAARSRAALVARVRRLHRAHPHRTDGIDARRRQPLERSGVGPRSTRAPAPRGAGCSARAWRPGDAGSFPRSASTSTARDSASRRTGIERDPRAGRRRAGTRVDRPQQRQH